MISFQMASQIERLPTSLDAYTSPFSSKITFDFLKIAENFWFHIFCTHKKAEMNGKVNHNLAYEA